MKSRDTETPSMFTFDARTGLDRPREIARFPSDLTEGHMRATQGSQAAASKAESLAPEWITTARRTALGILDANGRVTAAECRARWPIPEGADSRAYGAIFRSLASEGVIEKADIRTAESASRHAGLEAVWVRRTPPP